MNPLSSIHAPWPATAAPPAFSTTKGADSPISIPAAELRALDAARPGLPSSAAQPAEGSFANLLSNLVQDVNSKQGAAAQALQDLQGGRSVSLHQTMIAMEEASVSFQLMVEVRNRLLESYQELMRMQV